MKRVLVTGAGGSAAINFIASLRMAPEPMHVVGVDVNRWHLELPDVDRRYVMPPCSSDDYIERLNHIIEDEQVELVHPQPDSEVRVISRNRESIRARTFLPAERTIEVCQDKARLNRVLADAGVPVPQSMTIGVPEDVDQALSRLDRGNGKVWLRATRGAGARGSLPISEASHGRMWIDYWTKVKGAGWGDFMACEFLPGREFAFQSVWKEGELITSAARERLEYVFGNLMPSGQSSSPSVARTVCREEVNETATRAVLAVDEDATGVFCVDMKENGEGVPCVTEINAGRFFTTSNFFTMLGVNMPYLYVLQALGEDVPRLPKHNAAPDNCYWIRLMDCGPVMVVGDKWRSIAA